jgi:hypothetical protein
LFEILAGGAKTGGERFYPLATRGTASDRAVRQIRDGAIGKAKGGNQIVSPIGSFLPVGKE